jgi:DNA polymerase III subunit epsilon
LQPQYNRMLRQRESVTLVLAEPTVGGYAGLVVREAREITPEDGVRLLAVYTTLGRARQSLHTVAMRYRLCPKLMGLEKTKRACFQSQLGKCEGACEAREPVSVYNERFLQAFERQRVVTWPYSGAILIREKRPELEGSAGFVVDNWCLVAKLRELEDGTVETTPEAHRFDLDRYKIIRAYVEDVRHRRAISVWGRPG